MSTGITLIPENQRLGWRHAFRRTPLDFALIVFLASAFLGLWVSYDRNLSRPMLAALVGSVALYMVIARIGFSATAVRWLAWITLLVQSAFAVYFITQYSHLGYSAKIGFVSRLGRWTDGLFPVLGGFSPHPNALATFIEGGLPLGAGLWLSARNRRGRLVAGLMMIPLGYGLLLTASRGAWVAVAACAALTLITWSGRRLSRGRQLLGLFGLVVVAVMLGVGVILIGPDRVPGLASALSRTADRVELYVNSLYLIRDYPLSGIGLGGTFGLVYSKYILLIPHLYLSYAHSLPLAIWLNQGVLGIASFTWLLIAFYRLVVSHARRAQGTPLFWGAALGVTAMLMHGLTDASQYDDVSRWVMPIFFALLGLSVATAPSPSAVRHPLSSSRRIALATLLVVALVAGAVFLSAEIPANLGALQHTRVDLDLSLDDAARRQALDQAAHDYQRALKIDKKHPTAHWRLGLIALNNDRFREAIEHLEIARPALPGHRGVQKALGYAYLWDGQIDRAEDLLHPLHEVPQELGTWSWWRGTQGQDQLAEYARQLRSRLRQER